MAPTYQRVTPSLKGLLQGDPGSDGGLARHTDLVEEEMVLYRTLLDLSMRGNQGTEAPHHRVIWKATSPHGGQTAN